MSRRTNGNGKPNGGAVRGAGPVLITGGAGFIGTNLADRLARDGETVVVLDHLGRPGVEDNLDWLVSTHGRRIVPVIGDVRDPEAVAQAVEHASAVFHFAAQVAVTTSLEAPRDDFEVNAVGTLNVLEAIRRRDSRPPLVFTSTNKVYGSLRDLTLTRVGERYLPIDTEVRAKGVGEEQPLDFHSPYGCSKGAADQYVLDYARTYGLPATVFRMSCIYGPHQCGTEDQGWIAHFVKSALEDRPITLYGDGRQVRDVLWVEDLVQAFLHARRRIDELSGQAFNIGGGPGCCVSLLEVLERIEEAHAGLPPVDHGPWRTGDQRYYVSDVTCFERATGWRPRVRPDDGIARLYRWLRDRREPERLPTRRLPALPAQGVAASAVAERGVS
jgi:CDP-paratose 2-epimerase